MRQVGVMGAEGATGARQAVGSAGGGRSLKRKSRHSGKFWFSDQKVRPDLAFGTKSYLPSFPSSTRELGASAGRGRHPCRFQVMGQTADCMA